jgi:hypothetical protein
LAIGEVIAGSGMMSARAIAEALGENLSIRLRGAEPGRSTVDAVARAAGAARARDRGHAGGRSRRPALQSSRWRIRRQPEQSAKLAAALGRPTTIVLAEREMVRRGRWARVSPASSSRKALRPRLGEALLESGAVDLLTLDTHSSNSRRLASDSASC